jgi:quercetin dioxygenase-like cupin family protein
VTETAGGASIRTLAHGPTLEIREYSVPAGFSTGPSDHQTYEKAGYVVSGSVRITTPDGAVVLEAGGGYAIPRGVPHQFDVLEDAVMVQVRTPA